MPTNKKTPKKEAKTEPEEDTEFEGAWSEREKIIAVWKKDKSKRKAIVLDRKRRADGKLWYYVHFEELNRRNDGWVCETDTFKREDAGKGVVHMDEEEDGRGVVARKRKKGNEDVYEFVEAEHGVHDDMTPENIRAHEESTKVKNVGEIVLGRHRMETWYFSPLPREYWPPPDDVTDVLYFCEFTLKFFRTKEELLRHQRRNKIRHPPGNEVYRGPGGVGAEGKPLPKVAMFEVDGAVETEYCENISYIAKMFLDHKTLEYDTSIFIFYVMCELDEYGYHVTGYYSKDKSSAAGYNLACILTLPCHQRKGYGRFLIEFSYALSRIEGRMGSPEKPLSDLGLLSYRSYWSWVLLGILKDHMGKQLSVHDLVQMTSMMPEDILSTLQYLDVLKYTSGQHILIVDKELIESKWKRLDSKPGPRVDPRFVHYTPWHVDAKRDKYTIKYDTAQPIGYPRGGEAFEGSGGGMY
jgi:histone acetyltransferase MYST1